MELHFSEKTVEITDIEDRIKKMSLAHKIIIKKEKVQPAIKDGSKVYLGIDNMNSYLDQLDQEKEQWYYCNC
jgi:hypothetical protein